MFIVKSDDWPDVVEVRVIRPDGDKVPYTVILGERDRNDPLRECAECKVQLVGPVYRDPTALRIWHPPCFLQELRRNVAAGALTPWRLRRVVWDD